MYTYVNGIFKSNFPQSILSNFNGKGVEVGSFEGVFSKVILESFKGQLYLVDVYRALTDEEYSDLSNHKFHMDAYRTAMENIVGYEERAHILRMKSEKAVELFNDESLDFVYIDANHKYEYAMADINMWYPKVKKGGIVSGHDFIRLDWYETPFCPNGLDKHIYNSDGDYMGEFGVNSALFEFCLKNNITFSCTDEFYGTWWFVK